MSEHSEGEWWVHEDGRTIYAGHADEGDSGAFPWPGKSFVCEVDDTVEGLEGDDPTALANARLIAAAPDLLEACRALMAWGGSGRITDADGRKLRRTILAAIAKATGGAS